MQWTYVGAGVTTRTWTVTMPPAGGTYEFRLFLNGGYVRAATSPAVTVAAATPVLTVNTTSVVAGGSVTVTLTGGTGGSTDWLALAAAGAREHQLPAMDVRRRRCDDPHVDGDDAGDRGHIRVPPVPQQWILARGDKSHGDDDFPVTGSRRAHAAGRERGMLYETA